MSNELPPWWDETDLTLATKGAHEAAMRLWNDQGSDRRDCAEAANTLYFGNRRHSLNGSDPRAAIELALGVQSIPQSENVIQMVTDTMTSHIRKDRVRAFFQTEGGDTEQRIMAQGMMEAVEGVFFQEGIYDDLGRGIYQHGLLYDGGCANIYPDYERNRVVIERMPCWQWLTPEEEGDSPRQGYYWFTMDRGMALAEFGFDKDEDGKRVKNDLWERIKTAPVAPRDMMGTHQLAEGVADRILVLESFHLPSGYVDTDDDAAFGLNDEGELDASVDPGHDGVRMLQLAEDILLTREPWPHDGFNKTFFLPAKNPTGQWSRGVAETLAGLQLKINKLTQRIDGIMHKASTKTLVANRRAKVNLSKFTNDHVKMLECDGSPAQAVMHLQDTAPPAELFAERERLIEWAKAVYGLNEMTLYGEKPAGVDHAPGMEHLLDEQNLRHADKFKARDLFILNTAKWVVEACRMLAMRDPDFEVVFGDNKRLKRIKWREVELERNQFITKLWATNLLPQTPGMRMKRMTELANLGEPFKSQAVAALAEEYPDIEAITGPLTAERRNIENRLVKVAREGLTKETMPHPYLNLELAKSMAKAAINQLELDGEEKAMANVIEFWEAVSKLQEQMMPPPAPAAAAPPPGAVPPPVPAPAPPVLQ